MPRALSARWLVIVMRALVLVVVSNLALLVPTLDVGVFTPVADTCVDCDCPLERTGEECPPACPACHCDQTPAALPHLETSLLPSLAFVDHTLTEPPYEASLPPNPPLVGVFRPPRALAVVL